MSVPEPIILYVDDEKANRIVFQHSFRRRFRVLVAGSGREALDILREEQVGVLVTDQRMPDMSGNDLLLEAKEHYPNIIRVIVTAYSDLDPILRAVNEGLVARYIIKPWDREELEEILAWATEAFRLGQENSALHLRLLQTERLVTLGSIGAAVIHDINQPLSYLTTNSERLEQLSTSTAALQALLASHADEVAVPDRQKLHDLAEELPEIVSDMLEGCRIMRDMTTSIRRLLKPGTGSEVQVTDPIPPIRYSISVSRSLASRSRAHIAYEGPEKLPEVTIGATELNQVLINLLANAAQAMQRKEPPGGKVTLQAAIEDGAVRFVLADEGPGIPDDVLAKVGVPFFSTRPDGTGLGVAQCRRLVEGAGGTLRIESGVGRGTTVTFTIPVAPSQTS